MALGAARSLLDFAVKVRAEIDIEERLLILEGGLAGQPGVGNDDSDDEPEEATP